MTKKEKRNVAIEKQKQLKKMTTEALESLCENLEAGKSDELVNYLDVMSRFPAYSFRNLLLILSQKPDAKKVMGFKSWRQLGRNVNKGEKAIRIWAPMTIKEKGQESQSDSGEAEKTLIFRPVCVFDVSQTTGEELPELSDVSGEPGEHLARLKRFAEKNSIKVGYSDEIKGHGVSKCGEILLRLGLVPAVEFHVLAHEIAHEFIHTKKHRKEMTKTQLETEAEAVAYVVSKSIGLNTGHSSSDYIQLWDGNKEAVANSLTAIQQTASEIIGALH